MSTPAEQYAAAVGKPKGRRKYGNKPVTIDGVGYDSQAEGRRGQTLKLLERAGKIANLEHQPVYQLEVNGQSIGRYTGDFRYVDLETGETVLEDVKSKATQAEPSYRLRKKLVKALYGIEVREVQ